MVTRYKFESGQLWANRGSLWTESVNFEPGLYKFTNKKDKFETLIVVQDSCNSRGKMELTIIATRARGLAWDWFICQKPVDTFPSDENDWMEGNDIRTIKFL